MTALPYDVVELMTYGGHFDDAVLTRLAAAPPRVQSDAYFDDPLLARPGNATPRVRTALYRLYAADGALLYVGITMRLGRRFNGHRCSSKWWSKVDPSRTEVTWYSSRSRARTWEARAIREEKPPHNIRP